MLLLRMRMLVDDIQLLYFLLLLTSKHQLSTARKDDEYQLQGLVDFYDEELVGALAELPSTVGDLYGHVVTSWLMLAEVRP